MPGKMELFDSKMISSMGMDWEETSKDLFTCKILDIPQFEFTENDSYFPDDCMFDPPKSPKQQIISHDCMWSGTCGDESHPIKMKSMDIILANSTNVSSSSSASATQTITINNNSSKISDNNILINRNTNKVVGNSSAVNGNYAATQQNSSNALKQQNKIPAGRSLLLNSRTSGNNNNNNIISKQIQSCISRTVNDKGGTRPDTPLSLDDDSPEFKHHIDLAGTISGTLNSNCNRVRTSSDNSSHIITLLKEHLEDDGGPGEKSGNILEILSSTFGTNVDSYADNVLDYLKYLSDYEDDSAVDIDSDSDSSGGSGYMYENSSSSSSGKTEPYSMAHVSYDYQGTHFGDHSYTRPKDKYDTRDLGVQTPSDSEEEEIDVVSVGDRTLPTNPSARDRRHFAHKISARMVKTQKNGLRTIPPQRRLSDDAISPLSSSSNTPTKHYIPNPNHTATTTVPSSGLSKKRSYASVRDSNSSSYSSSNSSSSGNAAKKHRGNNKKQKTPNKRNISDTDEAETLEKRNLHNDMERQRRIGLKNLFEELKGEIPSIKDKERAPKVHILREAAMLCKKLTQEHEQYQQLKKHQAKLMAKLKNLRGIVQNQKRYSD